MSGGCLVRHPPLKLCTLAAAQQSPCLLGRRRHETLGGTQDFATNGIKGGDRRVRGQSNSQATMDKAELTLLLRLKPQGKRTRVAGSE